MSRSDLLQNLLPAKATDDRIPLDIIKALMEKDSPEWSAKARMALSRVGIEPVCELIGAGQSLYIIAKSLNMTPSTLMRWIREDDDRMMSYDRACQLCADNFVAMSVEVLEDVPDYDNASELRKAKALADIYKWVASRLDKQKFGEAKVPVDKEAVSDSVVFHLNMGPTQFIHNNGGDSLEDLGGGIIPPLPE